MEKKPEFVVTDRRKFTVDGEPRPDAASEPVSESPAPKAVEPPPAKPKPEPAVSSPGQSAAEPKPDTGYNAERERSAFGGQKMEFIHLLDMLVQTAMMYAGAMEGGAERRVDIVGLRQMVDLIAILEEKTKGNLTEQEQAILTNTLFQLRMTYMEIMNMIERQAANKTPGAPGAGRK
jgi:hypothetical protein